MSISVTPLGAGQDVGRSCLLVNIGGKRVMLDCGMHMGYQVTYLHYRIKILSKSRKTKAQTLVGNPG